MRARRARFIDRIALTPALCRRLFTKSTIAAEIVVEQALQQWQKPHRWSMARERCDIGELPPFSIARGKHAIAPLFRQGLNSHERVRIEGSAALTVAVRAPRKKIGETCYLLAGRLGRAGADGGNKA